MKQGDHGMREDGASIGRARPQEGMGGLASIEFIHTLPRELLEPHPLVRELRSALQQKEASLADKEREIARLHVALAFGIKDLPLRRDPIAVD